MMKVRDLIQVEEFERVIDIDQMINTEDKAKDLIQKYVITKDLRGHLKSIAENAAKPSHESYQIIGNYGSGKSHLLGILAAIFSNPELAKDIQDEEIRSIFTEKLTRKFAVVQFELQPGRLSLSDFFYDRIEYHLDKKYGIKIPEINTEQIFDHKAKIKEILDIIKAHDPQMGLVVMIDEISDFIKQKETKELKNRETQFMRVIAQASNAMDFMFISSMQENIFKSNEFVEEAESFGRTSERFKIITISKEDVKNVLSKRILKKDLSQQEQIKELLAEYGNQIPQVQSKLDQFVDLYPVHPYVVDIFNSLPYFEKRGILDFTVDQVSQILDKEFPQFITFEKIYESIAQNHNVKSLDEVSPVINAVETLSSKIDLLREGMREEASKIVKALAVLKLYGKTTNNGATPEELAAELMIISEKYSNTDRIKLVLSKLREVTDGQFINKTENDFYYIDLEHDIDYDVVIARKAEQLFKGAEDEELLKILKKSFELSSDQEFARVFDDYSLWKDRKSFRKGSFIYDDGSSTVKKGGGDYNFVFVSPYRERSVIVSGSDTVVVNLEYDEILDELLKKVAAISSIKRSTSYPKNIMDRKQRAYLEQLEDRLLKLVVGSKIKNGEVYEKLEHLISQEPDNLAEYFYEIKPALFNKVFNDKYPKYPKFLNQISYENIEGEVTRTMRDLFSSGEEVVTSNSQNLLSALGLLDSRNYPDTKGSIFAKIILKELKDNVGKNVKVDDLVTMLGNRPFGLDKELAQLVLIVLTYNGEINMKKRGGGTITASDLGHFFNAGLNKFTEVPYVSYENEFPVEEIVELFKVFDLNTGYIRQEKDRSEAVRMFRNEVLELQKKIQEVDTRLERFRNRPNRFLDLNALLRKREGLDKIPMVKFLKVKTVSDFKNVVLHPMEMDDLKTGLKFLENILEFLRDFEDNIYDSYNYVVGSLDFVQKHSKFFPNEDLVKLEELAKECEVLMDDLFHLLSYDERRILKGKMDLYRRKYKETYYRQHRKSVGQDVKWDKLDEINNNEELRRLNILKSVRGINTREFNRLQMLLGHLGEVKCDSLIEEHLETGYMCPHCRFPELDEDELVDINNTLDDVWNQVYDIKDEWSQLILDEIENYGDNINLLASAEQNIVNEILTNHALPEVIDHQVVTALNNLFSELEEVEITANDMAKRIFDEHGVMDYDTFVQKLDQIKDWILEHGDRENIRIKLKEKE